MVIKQHGWTQTAGSAGGMKTLMYRTPPGCVPIKNGPLSPPIVVKKMHLDQKIQLVKIAVGILQAIVGIWIAIVLTAIAWGGPQEELEIAYADLQQRPEVVRPLVRYLTLYTIPPRERDTAVAAIRYVLNSISQSAVLIPVDRVSETLVAYNLAAVSPRADRRQVWSGVLEALVSEEPYWHLKTVLIDTGEKRISDGPWLDQELAFKMREATLSGGAVMRADWWLVKVTVPPFYYAFSGVPETQDEWFKQFGIVEQTIHNLHGALGANLIQSGVTGNPRRVFRYPSPTSGGFWVTYDSRSGTDTDPIRDPSIAIRFDATEQIAFRPNGTMKCAIFDKNGKRVDAVPPDIALDDSTYPAEQLRPWLGCVRCHVVDDGIRSFEDIQSKLLSRETDLLGDPEQIEEIAAFYSRQDRLQTFAKRDREDHAAAVIKATGGIDLLTTVNALSRIVQRYERKLISLEIAAGEVGVDQEEAEKAWKRSTDPVLLAIRSGIDVQRSQWQSSFAEAAILVAEGE